jgi:hypothetical protein
MADITRVMGFSIDNLNPGCPSGQPPFELAKNAVVINIKLPAGSANDIA